MILPPRNFAAAASLTPILPLICRPSLTPANSCASLPTPHVLGKANTLIVCIDLGIHRDSFHQCLNVEPYALSGEANANAVQTQKAQFRNTRFASISHRHQANEASESSISPSSWLHP
jgi:hypothetical protein